MQITGEAIRESIQQNKIARIDAIDMARAQVSVGAVLEDLALECEGDTRNGNEHEYWGVDVDGNEWRVHVEVA